MNKIKPSLPGELIVEEAKKYIGLPYKWGENGPTSFDCSGFTQFVFKQSLGIHLSRSVHDQLNFGNPVLISDLKPGDLVFTFNAEHVGIYTGKGLFIHAPYDGQKIKISHVIGFYAARRVI